MSTEVQSAWATDAEVAWLRAAASTHNAIIEVGCWKGETTRLLAQSTRGTVWAVDHWLGTPHNQADQAAIYPDCAAAFETFQRNIEGLGVQVVHMSSHAAAAILLASHGATFDMIFIDADHAYDAVYEDIIAYRQLLWPGGLLCGHDYRKQCSGVRHAVDELLPGRVLGPGSLWSVIV